VESRDRPRCRRSKSAATITTAATRPIAATTSQAGSPNKVDGPEEFGWNVTEIVSGFEPFTTTDPEGGPE
jgi:hypothetical protein